MLKIEAVPPNPQEPEYNILGLSRGQIQSTAMLFHANISSEALIACGLYDLYTALKDAGMLTGMADRLTGRIVNNGVRS